VTKINLRALIDAVGGAEAIPRGQVSVSYRDSDGPAQRGAGATVIFPSAITVAIENGEPVEDLVVDPTGPAYFARIKLEGPGFFPITRNVAIPDEPEVDFYDLVDVDPLTYEPIESSLPAWDAAVAAVAASASAAGGSATAAGASAAAAEGSAAEAAASATVAASASSTAAGAANSALAHAAAAGTAVDRAETAVMSAEASATSALASKEAAEDAATSSNENRNAAASAAGAASASANAATSSATTAATSSGNAAASAVAASNSETAAAASASGAANSAQAAATARIGAQEARDSAFTRSTEAADSAASAVAAAAAIVQSMLDAEQYRDEASEFSASALQSKLDAAGSADAAATARASAETARTGAEAAANLALAGQFAGAAVSSGTSPDTLTNAGVYRYTGGSGNTVELGFPEAGFIGTIHVYARQAGRALQVAHSTRQVTTSDARHFWIRTQTSAGFTTWQTFTAHLIYNPAGQPGAEVSIWDDVNGRWQQVIGTLNPAPGSSTSLDALTVPGTYVQTATTAATLANNYPVAGIAAAIEVVAVTAGDAGNRLQRVTAMGGTVAGRGFWQRRKTSGTWSPWEFITAIVVDQTAGRTISVWDYLNSRLQSIYSDTGWRDISADLINSWAGSVYLSRQQGLVSLRFANLNPAAKTNDLLLLVPAGFRPLASTRFVYAHSSSNIGILEYSNADTGFRSSLTALTASNWTEINWRTTNNWPTSLPGSAVGSIPG
jgi:hypothetical protein